MEQVLHVTMLHSSSNITLLHSEYIVQGILQERKMGREGLPGIDEQPREQVSDTCSLFYFGLTFEKCFRFW